MFKRQKGHRVYVGTVTTPTLPSGLLGRVQNRYQEKTAARHDNAFGYEIWLATDGAVRGMWYSSTQRSFASLSASGRLGPTQKDDGTLQRLVRSARPVVPERAKPVDSQGLAQFPPPPDSLKQLCDSSHVIAVGRVAGILRNAHTPVSASGIPQHTVYVFAVETYLKADEGGEPGILKVWQTGGSLPWHYDDGRPGGVGSAIKQDPMLNVGDRYILFLKLPVKEFPDFRQQGYISAMVGDVSGKSAELDEYTRADPWRGKILLRDGFTHAPAAMDGKQTSYDHWVFRQEPQILDMPEDVAIAIIRQQIVQSSSRR